MSYFPKTEEDNYYEKLEEIIKANNLSGEEVLQLFTNYHGLQLLDDGFMEFIADEGYEI